MALLTEDQEDRESRGLHYWHIDYFLSLRFERFQAEYLDLHNVSCHDAQDLLERGCPHDLVLAILC